MYLSLYLSIYNMDTHIYIYAYASFLHIYNIYIDICVKKLHNIDSPADYVTLYYYITLCNIM